MHISENSRFSVIGYGSWATTIVSRLTSKGNAVHWLITNPKVSEGVIRNRRNPKYVSHLVLDTSFLTISPDINEVVGNGDVIILATPAAYLEAALKGLSVPLDGKFFISAIKGIVPDRCATVLDYMHEEFGIPVDCLGLISGPTHAEEVSCDRLSFLTAACRYKEDAEMISRRLGNETLRISTSTDVRGIEYASILKNIYAIASGIAAGMRFGDNFMAVFIAACAGEMNSFIQGICPSDNRDFSSCSYLGDLLVTCYSNFSRNRHLGMMIGKGCSVKSALDEMTMIAEGYFAADCIHRINMGRGYRNAVIAEAVYRILYENSNPDMEMAGIICGLL